MIDVLGLRFLLFNQPCNINWNVVTKILFSDLFSDHDETEKSQTGATRYVFNKVIPNVNDELICRKDFSHQRVSLHRSLNLLVDFVKRPHFKLQLFTLFGFLCFG
jgi:hypothetical protein